MRRGENMIRHAKRIGMLALLVVLVALVGGQAQALKTEYKMSANTRALIASNERSVKLKEGNLYTRYKKGTWKRIARSPKDKHITCFTTNGMYVYYALIHEGHSGYSDVYKISLKTRKKKKIARITGWIEAVYRYNNVLLLGILDNTEYDQHSIYSYHLSTKKKQKVQDNAAVADARGGCAISVGYTQDATKPVALYSIPLYTIPIETNNVEMLCANAVYPVYKSLHIKGDRIYYAVCIEPTGMKKGTYQVRSVGLDGQGEKEETRQFRAYQVKKVTSQYVKYSKTYDGKTHKITYRGGET